MLACEVFDYVENGLLPRGRLAIHLKPTAFRIKLRDRYAYDTGTSRNASGYQGFYHNDVPGANICSKLS